MKTIKIKTYLLQYTILYNNTIAFNKNYKPRHPILYLCEIFICVKTKVKLDCGVQEAPTEVTPGVTSPARHGHAASRKEGRGDTPGEGDHLGRRPAGPHLHLYSVSYRAREDLGALVPAGHWAWGPVGHSDSHGVLGLDSSLSSLPSRSISEAASGSGSSNSSAPRCGMPRNC